MQTLLTQLADALRRRQYRLATAESCTGGWIAKVCTDLPGSSDWFELGIVSYSNAAKQKLLQVSTDSLQQHGAVSEAVVREMATGVLQQSGADVALSVSGVAGPGGGSKDKPVGTVWFGWRLRGEAPLAQVQHFDGDREQVRRQAVEFALRGVLQLLNDHSP